MNNEEQLSEQKLHDDVIRMKSTLQYIEDDIENVTNRVSGKSYKYQIPNLYEKLTLFGEELKTIKDRLKKSLNRIGKFENRLNTLMECDTAICDSAFFEEHQEIKTRMERLKMDYKILKSKIILFTQSLEKNV